MASSANPASSTVRPAPVVGSADEVESLLVATVVVVVAAAPPEPTVVVVAAPAAVVDVAP